MKCHYSCLTCSKDSTNFDCNACDEANDFRILKVDSSCSCKDFYYDVYAKVCENCHPICKSCSSNLINDCNSCDNTNQFRSLTEKECKC